MKLELKRKALMDTYTVGDLFINDVFFSNVLEDKVRDFNKDGDLNDSGETKVYGKTAIPYGTYTIDLTYSNRFKKILPLIEDVPGFEGIRIHSGNSAEDSSGCLLCGNNTEKGKVTDSRKVFEKLMIRLVDAHEMKETITIKIS